MYCTIASLARTAGLLVLVWAGLVSLLGATVRGQQIALFDGRSLEGWTTSNGNPVSDGWIAEGGVLSRTNRGGNIFYQHEVGDFQLTFEWKIESGGNSGIKYRVRQYGNQWLGV